MNMNGLMLNVMAEIAYEDVRANVDKVVSDKLNELAHRIANDKFTSPDVLPDIKNDYNTLAVMQLKLFNGKLNEVYVDELQRILGTNIRHIIKGALIYKAKS